MSDPKYWVKMYDDEESYRVFGKKNHFFHTLVSTVKGKIYWQGDDYKTALEKMKEANRTVRENRKP